MFVVIEFDRNFTFGIDWNKSNKGIRLGFVAIHVVLTTFDNFINAFAENGKAVK